MKPRKEIFQECLGRFFSDIEGYADHISKLSQNPNTILIAQDGFIWIEANKKKQKLTNVYPKGMDESLTILWAGDLDGDKKVDLIIDDINHYNIWINYRLFLSSYAEKNEIVKEVANLTGVGC